jgi:cysteine desulfurase family protein (TIGR01976 family)
MDRYARSLQLGIIIISMALAKDHPTLPDVEKLRSYFPSLASGFAYLENAGGSQVPRFVPDAMRDYMLTTYVQTGAGYPQSVVATENVERAHEFANTFMGGDGAGKTILASSTTILTHLLANAYGNVMAPGTRIIAAETGHEANVGPWAGLARRGFDFQMWRVDPETVQCPLDSLETLLREKPTKIVAFPHVSNLLGEIVDARAIADLAHKYGARVVADGVAYAPHRLIDVQAMDADWYVYSCYKVYGPHMAALFGTDEALAEIEGPNHFFIPRTEVPYKFELGGIMHESAAGLRALGKYLNVVTGRDENAECNRETMVQAMTRMGEWESPLQKRYVDFLKSKKGVRIVGPAHGEGSRVTTISFVHEKLSPLEIVAHVHKSPIGIRYGDAYAHRLCKALGIDTATGVVRASFVHYNTVEEIDRLCKSLDEVL